MTYVRMSQFDLDKKSGVKLKDEHFEELFEYLSIVISTYLLPNDKYEIAKDLASDVMQAHRAIHQFSKAERRDFWNEMARKYNFYPNDAFDDVWMNVKLSTLDRAGLEP